MSYSHNFENKNSLLEMDVGVEGGPYGIIIIIFLLTGVVLFCSFAVLPVLPCPLNSAPRAQIILAPKATGCEVLLLD